MRSDCTIHVGKGRDWRRAGEGDDGTVKQEKERTGKKLSEMIFRMSSF